jgi:carboxylesterase type B
LLPVLAIFHGGGFQQGSARRYPNTTEIGHKYLSQGILVVVLQFRIGVLGM